MPAELFFLTARDAAWGHRFAIYHRPFGEEPRGKVVYIHPFAEEMNKSRRMAALQSRALARAGYAVLQIDLLGCGDSSGDFADATWDTWIDDVVEACRWLDARHSGPLIFWSLRAGCLLATRAAQRVDGRVELVFWQPPVIGAAILQQFLRLKLAAEIQGGPGKGVVDALRARIAAGETIEVAGYCLSAPLATGIATATLEPPSNA
jgi:exosortase A-associated hydrolase 2